MIKDELWMQIAIQEAELAIQEDEVPVGCILVQNEKIIARAHNQPINNNDPTAHAEIQALRLGGQILKNYRLVGCTAYVTLEPCAMCLSAMIHARVDQLIFGAYDFKSGVCGSCLHLQNEKIFNHELKIKGGILEQNCSELLQSFFKRKRK